MNLTNVPSPSQARGDFLNAITCGPPGRVPYCESHFSRKHMADLLGSHREPWLENLLLISGF